MAATPPPPEPGPSEPREPRIPSDIPTPTSLYDAAAVEASAPSAGKPSLGPISPSHESPPEQSELHVEAAKPNDTVADDQDDSETSFHSIESSPDGVQVPLNQAFEPSSSLLLSAPAEILDLILGHLSPYDLVSVAATCRQMRGHALSDILWYPFVRENAPGARLQSPSPFKSYHQLFAEYDPLWFLPKHKIWFSDSGLPGKLILVRYDPRRGCIEGYDLLAVRIEDMAQQWDANPSVVIQPFKCRVYLHLDKPVLQFRIGDRKYSRRLKRNKFSEEISVLLDERFQHMYSNLILTKPLDEETVNQKRAADYPYGHIWPPPTIPASTHVVCDRTTNDSEGQQEPPKPTQRSELSDKTFRLRRWMEMLGTSTSTRALLERMARTVGGGGSPGTAANFVRPAPIGIHMGEDVMTYSTLDPKLYTPTPTKPWRGIWVGDYSLHGCEFLLFNQPDDPPASDEELNLVRLEGETDSHWEKRRLDARIYRGRLEAIKLTGDANVPRGEYTFVAEDIGPEGTIELPPGPPFDYEGARAVKSRGHVANTGFQRDKFIESQLLLLSHDCIAQYWVELHHISYFRRIDIDFHLNAVGPTVQDLG
ncbi:unnamed protein product [Clonostachys rhizophaga]|uniref:F-box domain-containing protein n=1 Tax=Clonostachys rhizophaga TaxID=160324 RepID=A0A9N9VD44_9HYPO|nr:unnamed protein product [Clonostachys rhizophaga]